MAVVDARGVLSWTGKGGVFVDYDIGWGFAYLALNRRRNGTHR